MKTEHKRILVALLGELTKERCPFCGAGEPIGGLMFGEWFHVIRNPTYPNDNERRCFASVTRSLIESLKNELKDQS